MAGASTAPGIASSSDRRRRSALPCTATPRHAWRRTPCVVQNKILWFYARAEPVGLKIEEASMDGFLSSWERGFWKFVAPSTFYSSGTSMQTKEQQGKKKAPRFMLVVFCVPVAPDRSRLIWAFPRNFVVWLDMIIPRWFYHINQNSVLDSDAYILHVEERKFAASGLDNWQKDCYVPTARIVRHHGRCLQELVQEVLQESGWLGNPAARPIAANPYEGWSLGECTSCSTALKAMRVLEVALQVVSVAVVGFLAVAKETLVTSAVNRAVVVTMAVLCFAASRWLSNFIEKNFYFQDYSHAYK
ncbi:unnamed protein product [Urochloa decumbens]|uniref:Pheophorbide a oxygenase domain-containing protein n=1 Tax=Urochloa decumbens TaxID=240449 RepID=A0ABC8XM79_9POAL